MRFQVHNILEPLPHAQPFDIVLCRNVLLYLNAEKRGLAFDRLASAMAPDGWLMLGAGETVIGQTKRLCADLSTRGFYCLNGEAGAPADRTPHRARRARRGLTPNPGSSSMRRWTVSIGLRRTSTTGRCRCR